MKKKILLRGLLGAPIGVTINLIISLAQNDGNFYPVTPELTKQCGSEINAVIL